MRPCYRAVAVLGVFLLCGSGMLFGDSDRKVEALPKSAIARMGTSRFQHGAVIDSISVSKDGKTILCLGADGRVTMWDSEGNLKKTASAGFNRYNQGGLINAEAGIVVGPDNTGRIGITDVQTGKTRSTNIPLGYNYALSANGKRLLMPAKNGGVRFAVYDTADGKEIKSFGGGKNKNLNGSSAISGDGQVVAVPIYERNAAAAKFIIEVFDADGKDLGEIEVGQNGVQGVALSDDGKLLAYVEGNQSIKVVDLKTKKEVHQAGNAQMGQVSVGFSTDGKYLVYRGYQKVHVEDIAQGKTVREFDCHPIASRHGGNRQSVDFVSDKVIAIAQGTGVRFMDITTGKEVNAAEGHLGPVVGVRFSRDGKDLLTVGGDNTIRTWNSADGKHRGSVDVPNVQGRQRYGYVTPSTVSNDGKFVAQTGYDPQSGQQLVNIVELAGKKELFTVAGAQRVNVQAMAFSDDAAFFAAGMGSQVVLYNVATGKERLTINLNTKNEKKEEDERRIAPRGHVGITAQSLCFSPNGRVLAVTSLENLGTGSKLVLRTYELRSGKERDTIELLTAAGGGTSRYYQEEQLKLIESGYRAIPNSSSALAFSSDSRIVAIGTGSGIVLVDLIRRKEIRQFGGFNINTNSMAFAPNGKHFAAGNSSGKISIWDINTGAVVCQKDAHRSAIQCLAYSPDGTRLASGASDATAVVWDAEKVMSEEKAADSKIKLSDVDQLWADLADSDKAPDAISTLVQCPAEALKMLKERVKPASGAEAEQVNKLINDLNSESFEVREKAFAELEKLQKLAEPYLKKAVKEQLPTLEVRRRIEKLLTKLEGPTASPDLLRSLRVVEVLEYIASPEACDLLDTIAKGAEGAPESTEAKEALERIKSMPK